jgi:hypothetical protein
MISQPIKSASLRKETKSLNRFLIPMDLLSKVGYAMVVGYDGAKAIAIDNEHTLLALVRRPFRHHTIDTLRNILVSKLRRPSL